MTDRSPFYKRRSVRITAVVVAVPVLAVAWWLLSPLFIDEVVEEPFPMAAVAVIPDDMTAAEVEERMMEAAATEAPVYESMPEVMAPVVTGAADTTAEADETPTTTATNESTVNETTDPEASMPDTTGPVAVATGALMDADSFHRGSGEATVYRLEDGSLVLRLEDIEVTNGPDLHVIVAPGHGISNREALQAAGYIDLGSLKGNIGSQNYDFPADYQIPEQMTVVIYCVPFHVVFTTAELS